MFGTKNEKLGAQRCGYMLYCDRDTLKLQMGRRNWLMFPTLDFRHRVAGVSNPSEIQKEVPEGDEVHSQLKALSRACWRGSGQVSGGITEAHRQQAAGEG